MHSRQFGNFKISLERGDITKQRVDAIVNAANSGLRGGGGVDGAIHRAGGPAIMEECIQIVKLNGQCAPGNAVITGGGALPASYVIHAVGPIWRGGKTNEAEVLANAYRSCMRLAAENKVGTIAFPSISTGAYGYPLEEAAGVAIAAVKDAGENQSTVTEAKFVLFDEFTMKAYQTALEKV